MQVRTRVGCFEYNRVWVAPFHMKYMTIFTAHIQNQHFQLLTVVFFFNINCYVLWINKQNYHMTVTWCLLTISLSLLANLRSTSSSMYTCGRVMHLFWTRDFWICMNISTLRSIREGDWKSNLLLRKRTDAVSSEERYATNLDLEVWHRSHRGYITLLLLLQWSCYCDRMIYGMI